MFDKPILVYSDYCAYSKNFIKTLMAHQELFDSFIRMNIDVNPNTKKRPQSFYQVQQALDIKITKVPTVITPNAEYILSDVDAFKWLEHQIRLLTADTDVFKPFNPNEMTSFSDNYANFGSTNLCDDAKEQNFKFFENGEIPDDNYLQTSKSWDPNNKDKTNGFLNELESNTQNPDYNTKQNERQFFDDSRQCNNNNNNNNNKLENKYIQQTNNMDLSSKYNSQNQQRQNTSNQPRQEINFTDPGFGLSGQMNKSNVSHKSKEMDSRLKQLMDDRENIDKSLNQRR